MAASTIYIVSSIIALAIIAGLFFFVNKRKENKLSKLASISFSFVLAGIIFGEDDLIRYSLMGVGVIIAVIDMVKKSKKK